MYQQASKISTNPFIELADEIRSGDKSLKDLYYEQLISDLQHIDDEDYIDDLDFDADMEFRNNSEKNGPVPVVSFEFTKSVMQKVREIASQRNPSRSQSNAKFGLYLGNLNNNYSEKDKEQQTAQVSIETTDAKQEQAKKAPKTIPTYGTSFFEQQSQQSSDSAQSQWGGSQTLYSQKVEDKARNMAATKGLPEGESVVVVKQDSSKSYIIFALVAFIITIISMTAITVMRSSDSSDSGFSTLANNTSTTPAVVAPTTTPAKPAKPVVPTPAPVTTPDTAVANVEAPSLDLPTVTQSVPQNNLAAFLPQLINTKNIKYVSFRKEDKSNVKLSLKPYQAYNLSILLNNYQIQKLLLK